MLCIRLISHEILKMPREMVRLNLNENILSQKFTINMEKSQKFSKLYY